MKKLSILMLALIMAMFFGIGSAHAICYDNSNSWYIKAVGVEQDNLQEGVPFYVYLYFMQEDNGVAGVCNDGSENLHMLFIDVEFDEERLTCDAVETCIYFNEGRIVFQQFVAPTIDNNEGSIIEINAIEPGGVWNGYFPDNEPDCTWGGQVWGCDWCTSTPIQTNRFSRIKFTPKPGVNGHQDNLMNLFVNKTGTLCWIGNNVEWVNYDDPNDFAHWRVGKDDHASWCYKHIFRPGLISCPPWYHDVFPQEEAQLSEYSGAAAARQTIRWMHGEVPDPQCCIDTNQHPWHFPCPGFYEEYTTAQVDLYNAYHDNVDYLDFDVYDMRNCIQSEKPTEKWYGAGLIDPSYAYNFSRKSIADEDEAIRTFIHWFDFNVNDYYHTYEQPVVNNPNVPSLVATADATNGYRWMTLRGFVTDVDPCDESSVWTIPDLTVYGMWFNDPSIGGLGANAYITGEDFKENVFNPIDDYYRSVTEPPTDLDVELFNQNLEASQISYVRGKQVAELSMAMATMGDAQVRAAEFEKVNWEDVIPPDLRKAPDFKSIYENCSFNDSLKVADLEAGNIYELVTFRQGTDFVLTGASCTSMKGTDDVMWTCKYADGTVKRFKFPIGTLYPAASIVLLVDEEDGEFRQATWVGEDETYPPLTEDEAIRIAMKAVGKKQLKRIDDKKLIAIGRIDERGGDTNVRLVFDDDCSSRFLPMYEVTMEDGAVVRIMQDGTYVIL